MALTYFYAEWLGLALALISLGALANRGSMMMVMREVLDSRAMLFIIAIVGLFIGLLIVLTDNIWQGGAVQIFVTLLGWAFVVRSVLIFFLPHGTIRKIFRAFSFEQTYYVVFILVLVLGAYLAWSGFAALGA
jgi:hypothetical protein